jgi:hypothetical protein
MPRADRRTGGRWVRAIGGGDSKWPSLDLGANAELHEARSAREGIYRASGSVECVRLPLSRPDI